MYAYIDTSYYGVRLPTKIYNSLMMMIRKYSWDNQTCESYNATLPNDTLTFHLGAANITIPLRAFLHRNKKFTGEACFSGFETRNDTEPIVIGEMFLAEVDMTLNYTDNTINFAIGDEATMGTDI